MNYEIDSPLVSIVIPTYKRPDFLRECLQSVREQTYKNIEIIVVDDDINNNNSLEVSEICNKYKSKYFINTRNKGGCGARNTGIEKSTGYYIAFLDDDDVWLPHKIEEQLVEFSKNENASAIFCNYYELYSDIKVLIKSNQQKKISHEMFLRGSCPASTSLVIIKRNVLIDAGLFDENLPSFQDLDLWIRVSKNGPFVCCSNVLAKFRHHTLDRTSINIKKRIDGLDKILIKWQIEISQQFNINDFKKMFLLAAYRNNAFHSKSIFLEFKYRLKIIKINPLNIKEWIKLITCLFGYKFKILIFKLKNKNAIFI